MLFVYRTGVHGLTAAGHRWVTGTIVVSDQAEPTSSALLAQMRTLAGLVSNALGSTFGSNYSNQLGGGGTFSQQVHPQVKIIEPAMLASVTGGPALPTGSPEAAVRLQRVGAAGGLGRLAIPIIDTSLFTDAPHLRQIDAVGLQADVDANGANIFNQSPTLSGRL